MEKQIKKNEKKLKFSRKQKWRRNPAPWAALLAISILIGAISVVPDYIQWGSQKSNISKLSSANITLESEIETQKRLRDEEQIQFDKDASEDLIKESQRFPEKMSANMVSKILEIYALQINLSRRTFVDLKTMSFSNERPSPDGDFNETPVSISMSIDIESFKRLIKFIQTGKFEQQLVADTISAENKGETIALEFLEKNLLPWARINSMNITEDEANEDFPKTIYNVQMQVLLFSQANS